MGLATQGRFSCARFPYHLQRSIVVATLNSNQQAGRVFVTSIRPRDFAQMAFEKHFNLWVMAALEP